MMEIGTEISKKIRAAIKGKLQELGAYVDDELPDYIMVMVANKKSAQQMADDLSLFLGTNTVKFTVWLHGVLEKLRSVAVEPPSLRPQVVHSETNTSSRNERKGEESRALAVSSSRSERLEGRVSSSAHEHHGRRASSDRSSTSGRLTSAVKPLVESALAEAVIDIKPDLEDDDLMTDPDVIPPTLTSRGSGRSRTAQGYRSSDVTRGQDRTGPSYGRSYREGSSKEELSRKRKAPMASSVVRVQKGHGSLQESDDNEDEDDDDVDYGLPSRVSLPAKPERKPTLPLAKQANKNLILKAISEAQESISRTTAAYTAPQRQMVPVAPRTRPASDEMNRAAMRLVQEHLHTLLPQEPQHTRQTAQSCSLASRLQQEFPEEGGEHQREIDMQLLEAARLQALDTRSFIMRQPELDQAPPVRSRLDAINPLEAPPTTPRTVQTKERSECSPKFIVTLDGVPSPLIALAEQDPDADDAPNPAPSEAPTQHSAKPAVHLRLSPELGHHVGDDEWMEEEEEMDVEPMQLKRQKVTERCRYWPACKSGDQCVYHHPTSQCRMFPSCVYGDKCLYIHPNCKYDAKCSKPDCPFTHVSRRGPAQPLKPAPAPASSVCRFFPDCKRTDCTFYHPKPCRFATHCKRAGCTFYHPAVAVPPRHALKWSKAQAS